MSRASSRIAGVFVVSVVWLVWAGTGVAASGESVDQEAEEAARIAKEMEAGDDMAGMQDMVDDGSGDETPGATSQTPPLASPDNDPDRYPDLDVPTKPWAYDTGYFFGLTRGLDDESLSTAERSASMVGTIPLDVFGLPAAAVAGLFGS